jgi:hypothetical protein
VQIYSAAIAGITPRFISPLPGPQLVSQQATIIVGLSDHVFRDDAHDPLLVSVISTAAELSKSIQPNYNH